MKFAPLIFAAASLLWLSGCETDVAPDPVRPSQVRFGVQGYDAGQPDTVKAIGTTVRKAEY
jgi:hypothetical protein